MASLQSRLQDLAVRFGTETKQLKTFVNGNVSSLTALKTTTKTNLVAAINELFDRSTSAGTGDMQRATYDTDNDGVVDRATLANAVPWAGVTGKPTQFPPAPHDASLVTTGVFDVARIPVLPSQIQVMSSGGIADLTGSQQTQVGQGTIVTTTDGFRYVYSGSGSKTAPASYVALADVTPEFAAIANKPTTAAGFGITDVWTKTEIGNPDTDLVAVFETAIA